MLAAFFIVAFLLATLGRWDERVEDWVADKAGLETGALATTLTNFLGMGASLGAAAIAPGPALTVLALGVAGYFVWRLALSIKRLID